MNTSNQNEIYQSDDGQSQIDVSMENETLWVSQVPMAELYENDSNTIGLHLKNIYKEGALAEAAFTGDSLVVLQEDKLQVKRLNRFYKLYLLLSVGYRVSIQQCAPVPNLDHPARE